MSAMKKILLAVVLSLTCAGLGRALDIADVIQLVAHRVDDSVVVNMVVSNPLLDPVTPDEVIMLHNAGASTELLQFLTGPEAHEEGEWDDEEEEDSDVRLRELMQLIALNLDDSIIINIVLGHPLPDPLTPEQMSYLAAGGASPQLLAFLSSPQAYGVYDYESYEGQQAAMGYPSDGYYRDEYGNYVALATEYPSTVYYDNTTTYVYPQTVYHYEYVYPRVWGSVQLRGLSWWRPRPSRPGHGRPNPGRPSPGRPNPGRPGSGKPDTGRPKPGPSVEKPVPPIGIVPPRDKDKPSVVRPSPGRPAPEKPALGRPNRERPSVSQPAPVNPSPERPTTTRPGPARPAPEKPAPSKPAPSRPAPERPAPSRPAPSRPAPSKPGPTRPAPQRPAPSKPAPEKPAPGKPAPSRPSPSRPNPPSRKPNPQEEQGNASTGGRHSRPGRS